jgi:hypothetical protein
LNPRRPAKDAAVFKTAPFDRSGTPPWDSVTQACATTWRVTQLRFFTVKSAQTLSQ